MLSRRIAGALLKACRNYQRTLVRHMSVEGEYSKTTLDTLDDSDGSLLFIDGVSPLGFKLHRGVRIFGPLAIFPKSVFQWNVASAADINEESLRLFTILEPKIDILILGVGEKSAKISPEVIRHLRSKKMYVEICPTHQAISTFNYLNAERRYVAGGLIPPSYIELKTASGNIPLTTTTKPHKDVFFGTPSKLSTTETLVENQLERLGQEAFSLQHRGEVDNDEKEQDPLLYFGSQLHRGQSKELVEEQLKELAKNDADRERIYREFEQKMEKKESKGAFKIFSKESLGRARGQSAEMVEEQKKELEKNKAQRDEILKNEDDSKELVEEQLKELAKNDADRERIYREFEQKMEKKESKGAFKIFSKESLGRARGQSAEMVEEQKKELEKNKAQRDEILKNEDDSKELVEEQLKELAKNDADRERIYREFEQIMEKKESKGAFKIFSKESLGRARGQSAEMVEEQKKELEKNKAQRDEILKNEDDSKT